MPVVLITGSGKRLGKGLAIEFAKKNWDIIVHFNSSDIEAEHTLNELELYGVNSIKIKANLRNDDEIKKMFIEIKNKNLIPDVLINNAGVFPPVTKISELDDNQWDEVFDINLKASFKTSKYYFNILNKPGRIINIASSGAFEVWNHRIPYNISKSALIKLTKVLAKELAPNITVNCVAPSSVLIPEEPSPNDKFLTLPEKIPSKRYGYINDVFDAVYFFSTCSDYITGQILSVDGGYHLNE